MVRAITRSDINEVRSLGINLETIAGYKGASVVQEVIDDAINKGVTIVCIGGNETGKSTALKTILGTVPNYHDGLAVDGLKSENDIKLIKLGVVKFAVLHAEDARDAYNKITCNATDVAPCILLIELTLNKDGQRTINGVYEIIVIDNSKHNTLIPIVDIHKEKFRKINDLY